MTAAIVVLVVVLLAALGLVAGALRVIRPDERGLVFRYGRALPALRDPGVTLVVPFVDRLHRICVESRATEVPSRQVVTRDGATVRIGARVRTRVGDPRLAGLSVPDVPAAVAQVTENALPAFIGHCDAAELAVDRRDTLNEQLREMVAEPAGAWGVHVERVELLVPDREAARGAG